MMKMTEIWCQTPRHPQFYWASRGLTPNFPAGKVEVIGSNRGVAHDFDLNGNTYRANDWGRTGTVVTDEHGQQHIEKPWLHSDVKNMAYYYVYPAFTNIVKKGEMK
jgi:hypothetical protein